MTPNPVSMTNYREYDGVVRVTNGVALPIEGVGDILMSFQSDFGEPDLQLFNVAFVPLLSHNLLSLSRSRAVPVTPIAAMLTGWPCSASQADGSLPSLSGNSIKCEDTVHEATVHVQQSLLL